MWIVFIGPPGAGKGTQCKRLAGALGIPHLSTGELLRSTLQAQSPLSTQIASFINRGHLAPDALVMSIVQARLATPDAQKGCVFDGFPRTIPQAQLLDSYLSERGQALDLVLNLVVDRDELVQRMLRRAKVECRADDTAETITARFEVFHRQTAPLLDYYRDRGLIHSIDGSQTPQQVGEAIWQCVAQRAAAISGGSPPSG